MTSALPPDLLASVAVRRLAEEHLHRAAELAFEVLGQLFVVALAYPFHARARQWGGERVHDDDRQRPGIGGDGGEAETDRDCGRGEQKVTTLHGWFLGCFAEEML